ncbi:MAG: hypothetical protein ABIK86_07500 [candidate division WOR-3 bacterium]
MNSAGKEWRRFMRLYPLLRQIATQPLRRIAVDYFKSDELDKLPKRPSAVFWLEQNGFSVDATDVWLLYPEQIVKVRPDVTCGDGDCPSSKTEGESVHGVLLAHGTLRLIMAVVHRYRCVDLPEKKNKEKWSELAIYVKPMAELIALRESIARQNRAKED